MRNVILFLIYISIGKTFGQNIIGEVFEIKNAQSIISASISLYKDGTFLSKEISNLDGEFRFNNIVLGEYTLVTNSIGCKNDTTFIELDQVKDFKIKIKLSCKSIICTEFISDSSLFDFNTNGSKAIDFITFLKLSSKSSTNNKILNINGRAKSDWITINDIEYLITLIESKEKSKCVWTSYASVAPNYNNSTIGGQVMNLIDSYRLHKNYPYFLIDCSETDRKRIKQIKKWWKNLIK